MLFPMPATDIPLSILDTAPSRPVYANGPRDLSAVKLLRISITDRCNFRCVYCMPEDGVRFYDHRDVLTQDDIIRVASAARRAGVTHFKITGGEPTVRKDLCEIISRLKALDPEDLSLTTNGSQLCRLAGSLKAAGLDRLTLSIDTLQPDRFHQITGGRGNLADFWENVHAAQIAGFRRLKFNAVVIGGFNDDEAADLAGLTIENDWTMRFIEYMPLGDSQLLIDELAHSQNAGSTYTVDNAELLASICQTHGAAEPITNIVGPEKDPGVGPAQLFKLSKARGRIGFISAMSRPFCESCNRLRLTANGQLRACLFDGGEVDMIPTLRDTRSTEVDIVSALRACVAQKPETHSGRGNRQMSQLGG